VLLIQEILNKKIDYFMSEYLKIKWCPDSFRENEANDFINDLI